LISTGSKSFSSSFSQASRLRSRIGFTKPASYLDVEKSV
jgi:hypothetical protein